jgi:hypothetical protein
MLKKRGYNKEVYISTYRKWKQIQEQKTINIRTEAYRMTLDFFKDILFELLNDMDEHMLADIVADDRKNSFALWMADGCGFEIKCRKLEGRMQKNAEC